MPGSPFSRIEQDWIAAAQQGFGLTNVTAVDRVRDVDLTGHCRIFRLTSNEGSFALKVYPSGWQRDRLDRAYAAAEYLSRKGFPAPRPLQADNGSKILFIGQHAALCTTWLPGQPLWDPLKSKWIVKGKRHCCLLAAMQPLADFHRLMKDLPERPTRIRGFGGIEWFSQRLSDAQKLAAVDDPRPATKARLEKHLTLMGRVLRENDFPETFDCQFILVDCHPGQFLFDNDTFTGIVDFDHVATGVQFRDLSKFLATNTTTLRLSPQLVKAYLSVGDIPIGHRTALPAGIVRYIVTSAINRTHKSLAESLPTDSVCNTFCKKMKSFFGILPSLRDALEVSSCHGLPNSAAFH